MEIILACSGDEAVEWVGVQVATGLRGVKFESESKSQKVSVFLYSIDRYRGPLKTWISKLDTKHFCVSNFRKFTPQMEQIFGLFRG